MGQRIEFENCCLTDPEGSIAAEAPVHSRWRRDAGNLATEMPLQRRCPWDEAEPKAVVDHRETPGGERNALPVNAGDVLALLGGPTGQPSLGNEAPACCRKLALAQGVEQVAREQHPLTLPARKTLADQVFGPPIESRADLASEPGLG